MATFMSDNISYLLNILYSFYSQNNFLFSFSAHLYCYSEWVSIGSYRKESIGQEYTRLKALNTVWLEDQSYWENHVVL